MRNQNNRKKNAAAATAATKPGAPATSAACDATPSEHRRRRRHDGRQVFSRLKAVVAPPALSSSGVGARDGRDQIRPNLHGRWLLRPNQLLRRVFLHGFFGDYVRSKLGSSRSKAKTPLHQPSGPLLHGVFGDHVRSALGFSRVEAKMSLRPEAAPAIWATRRPTSTAPTMCSLKYPQGCYFTITSLDSECPKIVIQSRDLSLGFVFLHGDIHAALQTLTMLFAPHN
ncbi:uncharacterized protein [Miscanthus floridulus]|uniref:uncharacterized protein n=1 Tax=Miscanthus floridulus TaxID=154761 RepID=UPI003458ACC0